MSLFKQQDDSYWASVSDLMSGLMMLFLLIAIAYMLNVAEGQRKVKKIAVAYQEIQLRECPAYILLYQFSPKDTGQSKVK